MRFPAALPGLLVLVAVIGCGSEALAAVVQGIALSRRGPVAGATVLAFPSLDAFLTRQGAVASQPGEKPGQFRLELAAGSYYLIAQGEDEDGPLFAYHGLNPLAVTGEERWLPILLVPAGEPECRPGPTGIRGQLLFQGQPLDRGSVSVYAAEDGRYRGMGLQTRTLEADGRFALTLEAGAFVVVGRQRQGPGALGPLAAGDLFCLPAASPLTLAAGQSCELAISCYPRDDLAAFLDPAAVDPRGRRQADRRQTALAGVPAPQMPAGAAGSGPPTLIQGQVVDLAGLPLAGLYVTAYPADQHPLFQMHAIRLLTPAMTMSDEAGRFRLRLPAGGSYYLQAREHLGAAPVAGERFGLYQGSANHSLAVAAGEMRAGIELLAGPIMPEPSFAALLPVGPGPAAPEERP
ncbi:MAG: carboxypeptidase-like regulatory domain-containing protein [Thermodesulfobacteriota bacterium]